MKAHYLSVIFAGMLAQTGAALASSASASIDWDAVNVQVIDFSGGVNTPIFTITSVFEEASSYASVDFLSDADSKFAFGSLTLISTSALTSYSQSDATVSPTTLGAHATAQPKTHPWLLPAASPSASGYARNSIGFEFSGHGIALLTMDWSLHVQGIVGDTSDYSTVSISIEGGSSDNQFNLSTTSSNYRLSSMDSGNANQNASFVMAVVNTVPGTSTGYLNAVIDASAIAPSVPVPEPETYALMLVGLGLVGFMARRGRSTS